MMQDRKLSTKFPLWTPRPVEETLEIYADWAAHYDADLAEAGYDTPHRISAALKPYVQPSDRILDFGCGTGLSGLALQNAGFTNIDGLDISAPMLEKAKARALYANVWQGRPGEITGVTAGQYSVIVAPGVVSLGAAPPETLSLILGCLAPGGFIGLSFNDPTVAHGSYDAVLDAEVSSGRVELLFRENGLHLREPPMGSDVLILRRQ
jgi:predicted TPR repeat methyltransferase